jgi:hypothetical protein
MQLIGSSIVLPNQLDRQDLDTRRLPTLADSYPLLTDSKANETNHPISRTLALISRTKMNIDVNTNGKGFLSPVRQIHAHSNASNMMSPNRGGGSKDLVRASSTEIEVSTFCGITYVGTVVLLHHDLIMLISLHNLKILLRVRTLVINRHYCIVCGTLMYTANSRVFLISVRTQED